jgi:hypothetical protein
VVLRLTTTRDSVAALIESWAGSHSAIVVAQRDSGGSTWRVSNAVEPVDEQVVVTSMSSSGTALVVVRRGDGECHAIVFDTAGDPSFTEPTPRGACVVAESSSGALQAFGAHESTIDVYGDTAAGSWRLAQRLVIPIYLGSSR